MFVRWKRRPAKRIKSWSPPDEQAWDAVLVESRCVDGKPRQHVVRHLGSIREGGFSTPMTVDRFWTQVDAALAAAGVTGAVLEAAESKVPPWYPALILRPWQWCSASSRPGRAG